MAVGESTGYVENEEFTPDPLSHGSLPTDGLKGVWDSNLRRITTMWDHLPWHHSAFREPEPTVAAPVLPQVAVTTDIGVSPDAVIRPQPVGWGDPDDRPASTVEDHAGSVVAAAPAEPEHVEEAPAEPGEANQPLEATEVAPEPVLIQPEGAVITADGDDKQPFGHVVADPYALREPEATSPPDPPVEI